MPYESRVRGTQPPQAENACEGPLSSGLVGLWNLNQKQPINTITGEVSAVMFDSNCVPAVGAAGMGLRANSGTEQMLRLAASRQALVGPSSAQIAIALYSKLEGNVERGVAFDSCRLIGSDDTDGWQWLPNFLGSIRWFKHGTTTYTTATRQSDTRPVLRIFSAGPQGFWWSEDGVIQATSATVPNALTSTDAPFYLGGSGADTFDTWHQHAFGIALWKDAKPQSFAAQLGVNFWQLFEPELIWVPTAVTVYRPGSDVVVTGWTGTPDNVNLYTNIDEASASDADYVTSPNIDGLQGPLIAGLTASVPVGTWDVKYRSDYNVGAAKQVRMTLLDSSNVSVGAGAWQTVTTSFVLYTSTITTTGVATRFKIEVQ